VLGQAGWRLAIGGHWFHKQHLFLAAVHLLSNRRPVELYGYKYPIQNCTSGTCYPGYLYWNGYIPANLINSHNAAGQPNGYEGIPSD